MTSNDVIIATRDFVKCLTNMEFTGKIEVKELNPVGYEVQLYFHGNEYPTYIISANLTDKQFLQFLFNDLKNRSLWRQSYFTLKKVYDKR